MSHVFANKCRYLSYFCSTKVECQYVLECTTKESGQEYLSFPNTLSITTIVIDRRMKMISHHIPKLDNGG